MSSNWTGVIVGLVLSGAATAQLSDGDRKLLLGEERDLEKLLEQAPTRRVESLTKLTPPWLRILIRRTWEKESTAGLLRQIPRLLRDRNLIEGIDKVIARAATDKLMALEGEWLTTKEDELELPVLAGLASIYGLLMSTQEYVDILTSSAPWEPMLAMFLSREYRLTKEQYSELFAYLKKLPARARDLHTRAATILLRRSEDRKLTSSILRQLSFTYRTHGKPQAAVVLMREALRRAETIEARDLVLIARDYARSLDSTRARRALSAARANVAVGDLTNPQRETITKWMSEVEGLIEIADEVKALDQGPADERSVEDKIRILGLLRRLLRPVEAGKLAQELDSVPVRDSRVYSNLGLLCMRGGLRDKAVKCLRIAEQLPNADGTLHQLRAWLLLRPLLEEGILFLRDEGDVNRTMRRLSALRDDVAVLVTKHGIDELAVFRLVLELVTEFRPAIENKDLRLGIEILKKNNARMLELRESNFDILGLRQLALCGIGLIQDPGTIRRVLSEPTTAEAEEPSLLELRCVLAYVLRQHESDLSTKKLVRSTFSALPASAARRHILLGVEAAMTAEQTGEAEFWDFAIRHFRAGLKVEKLTANERARLLNGIGMCLYFQGKTEEASEQLAAAVAVDPDGSNTARLNVIICEPTLDRKKLAALAALAAEKNWSNLNDEVARWQIAAAREDGDTETAKALAKRIVESRSVLFPVGHPMIMRDGNFTWSLGATRRGAELRVMFQVTPWLTRRAPVTGEEIDTLAK